MIITDKASKYINEMIEANNVHTLRVTYEGEGNGTPLWGITLDVAEESDILETVNDVSVAIAKEVVEVAAGIKLDFEEGSLVILGIDD